jgi:hypothetical protein
MKDENKSLFERSLPSRQPLLQACLELQKEFHELKAHIGSELDRGEVNTNAEIRQRRNELLERLKVLQEQASPDTQAVESRHDGKVPKFWL